MLCVALLFLHMSISHALSKHSVTRTNNFLSRARPAPNSTRTRNSAGFRTRPANASTRAGQPAPRGTLVGNEC